jgi:hypothetical protein
MKSWTHNKPTSPGYYWFREPNDDYYMVKVTESRVFRNGLFVHGGPWRDDTLTYYGSKEAQWQGPITPDHGDRG